MSAGISRSWATPHRWPSALSSRRVRSPSPCTPSTCSGNWPLEHLRRLKLHRQDEIEMLLAEARRDAEIWMLIDCATNDSQPWPSRRRALRQLRELCGTP